MSADAIRFEVIDDLPSVFADAVKFVSNDGEDVNFVHPDHLGAPQKMTDVDRNIVWDASFLPFGEEDSLIGSAANDNRFPGQRLEAETGLHYNYFRDYDPTTGRYLQSDPIGLAGGINTYGYVSGNPVNYIDPKGLFCVPCLAPLAPGAGKLLVDGVVIGLGILAVLNTPSENADDDTEPKQCPPLPDDLLGENVQDGSGNRKNSDLSGGKEAAEELFDRLTGGTGKSDPDNPDHSVGENGVRLRPGKSGQGPRVDIPAKGGKPHETIHFY